MLYELATLTFLPHHTAAVLRDAEGYIKAPEAGGRLLGAWTTDVGALGRLLILRAFDTGEALAAERERALFHPHPFGRGGEGGFVTAIEMDSYKGFPFLPTATPGDHGKVYEIRTYRLKPGGLPPTVAAWEAAMPDRSKMSPLVINMYALDGAPRITHIWPYKSASERFEIRAQALKAGIWPPKGAPEQLLEASSTLCVPAPFSPLA